MAPPKDQQRIPWYSCPDRGCLIFLTNFLFESALTLCRTASWETLDQLDHFTYTFWRTPAITKMLSQHNLEALYLAIA